MQLETGVEGEAAGEQRLHRLKLLTPTAVLLDREPAADC